MVKVNEFYIVGIRFCSWNATYESLLGTNKPFPQPIPLAVSLLRSLCILVFYLVCSKLLGVQPTGNGGFPGWCLGTGGTLWLTSKSTQFSIVPLLNITMQLLIKLVLWKCSYKQKQWPCFIISNVPTCDEFVISLFCFALLFIFCALWISDTKWSKNDFNKTTCFSLSPSLCGGLLLWKIIFILVSVDYHHYLETQIW